MQACVCVCVAPAVNCQCYKKADYGDTGDQDATSASQSTSDLMWSSKVRVDFQESNDILRYMCVSERYICSTVRFCELASQPCALSKFQVQ